MSIQDQNFNNFQTNTYHNISLPLSLKSIKLSAITSKIINDNITTHNKLFHAHLQNIKTSLSRNSNKKFPKKRSSSKLITQRKKKIMQKMNLPFQMYIYSSCDSDNQNYQNPFRIQCSSASQNSEILEQRQVVQAGIDRLQGKMFSFAKNNFLPSKRNDVLSEVDFDEDVIENQNTLSQVLTSQIIQQLIDKYTSSYQQSLLLQQASKASGQLQQKLQVLIQKQLQNILQPYYKHIQNETIETVSEQYFTKVYFPSEMETLDEKLFIKQQQSQIKQNQLQTLETILKEIRSNNKIQYVLDQRQATGPRYTKVRLQNDDQNIENNHLAQEDNKKRKQNIVPFFAFNELQQPMIPQKHQNQKAKNSRGMNGQLSHRSQGLQKSSSRAGRRYYYQKDSEQISKANSSEQRSDKKTKNLSNKQNAEQQEQSQKTHKSQQQENKKMKQNVAVNIGKIISALKNQSQANQPGSVGNNEFNSQLLLKKFDMQVKYNQNLQAVITYEIQHLKAKFDALQFRLEQIDQKYEDKYKTVEVMRQIESISGKQAYLKKKLKAKIKQFWKIVKV